MAVATLSLRLLLACLFAIAAWTKLRDRRGFARTLPPYGVPSWAAGPLSTMVPTGELVAAVLLVPTTTVVAGIMLALLLLFAFSAAVGIALLRGRTPDCACFGTDIREPIGTHTLWRNAALTLMAGLVLIGHTGSSVLPPPASPRDWKETAFGLATTALAVGLLFALRDASRWRTTNRALGTRLSTLEAQTRMQPTPATSHYGLDPGGLPIGAPAPAFDLPRLEGDRASLASALATGQSAVLVFLSAHCPACHELWPDIERWQRRGNGRAGTVLVVCSGSPQTLELKLMGHDIKNVLLEEGTSVADAYALSLRPAAVIVGPDGSIKSPSVAGVHAIRALVDNREPTHIRDAPSTSGT